MNLRPEHKRLQNPHLYHVSLGEKLFAKKTGTLENRGVRTQEIHARNSGHPTQRLRGLNPALGGRRFRRSTLPT